MKILTAYEKFLQVAIKYMFSMFGLPKTDQTTIYKSGDDGTYRKGYPKTAARFTDNGDGTITDNATGLMWIKDGAGAGCNNGNQILWEAAIDFCEALDFAGHTDWRLPNIKELMSIVDYGKYNQAINALFVNYKSAYYWSSTTHTYFTDYAWIVHFIDGFVYKYVKTNGTYISPVRGEG